ncbi:PE family protein [Mycobacterium sp. E787]|uniref:PE family protein n=1 Tax=Mycobacterium sp. E787 TaxID=1834150 RepID=UPI0009EDB386|nr:PE family protein [Mycobacterium sp. E787]
MRNGRPKTGAADASLAIACSRLKDHQSCDSPAIGRPVTVVSKPAPQPDSVICTSPQQLAGVRHSEPGCRERNTKMSFVTIAPQFVEAAAQDLAGIGSSLSEATSAAAAPTTALAPAGADEVSAAIAALFGDHAQQFQAVAARASAFHEQFVGLLNSGAGAYLGTEVANAEQTMQAVTAAPAQSLGGAVTALQGADTAAIGQSIAGFQTQFAALEAGGVPGLINGFNTFGADVAAPYQALVTNTAANLQAIGGNFTANPLPLLHQIASNQIGYAQAMTSAMGTGMQNLPAALAGLPATIQTGAQTLVTSAQSAAYEFASGMQALPADLQTGLQALSANPAAFVQHLIANQIGSTTIGASLQLAGQDINAGLPTASAGFHSAFQDLLAGNPVGAYDDINQSLINAFLPAFNGGNGYISGSVFGFNYVPLGPLGDLAPIFALPGQMAQNLTNLLPAGSIPAQMAQNLTNLVDVSTNFGATLNLTNSDLTFGLPLQVLFDAIGGPANALSALNSTGVALAGAVQTGNASAAAAALLDAPAFVANGFLNGSTLITLPPAYIFDFQVMSLIQIPLGGVLTPLSYPLVFTSFFGPPAPFAIGTGSTEFGGLIPGLLSFGPELAQAIA